MASITHTKVSAIADDPTSSAAGEVLPSDWNAAHTFLVNQSAVVLGRVAAGSPDVPAAVEEIPFSAVLAGSQPLDADLTAIAALTTAAYGRSFLALANAAAARTLTGAASLGANTFTAMQTLPGPIAAGTDAYAFSVVPVEAAAVNFNLISTSYASVGDSRTNQVFKLGANAGPSLIEDNAEAGIMDTWESHYAPDANRYVERHISFVPAGAATEIRLWSAMVNKATSVAGVSNTSDTWNWITRSDQVVRFNLHATNSFLNSKFDIGPGNTSSTGQTLNVRDVAGATAVTIRAGGAQGGTDIFTVAKVNGTYAFKVDTAYDAYFTGTLQALSHVSTGESTFSSVIFGAFKGWLTNAGSLTMRNSSSGAGIFFTSTAFAYDAGDISMVRNAAGVMAFTDGSAGVGSASTYRDIQVRSVLAVSFQEYVEMTAPAAPAANKVRLYAVDNGSGKTQLMALFPSGVAQQVAIEP